MNDEERSALPGLGHRFAGPAGTAYTIAKPFGPNILETTLPDDVFARMLDVTNAILDDTKRQSWGRYLVGQIREEPVIPDELLKHYDVYDYLRTMFAEYVIGCMYCDGDVDYKRGMTELKESGKFANPTQVTIEAAWIVSQREGEYNPIHSHSHATLSSVMYLKVPEVMQRDVIPNKVPVDGCIELVDRSAGSSMTQLQNSTVRIRPEAGRFYIFPSNLLHLVYPFKGGEERRSVSINASHSF